MANKTLKSIKFPNLPDTYTIIQSAPEYDPENYYEFGDICIYQGGLYKCSYIQETENDDPTIQGIAPDDSTYAYWEEFNYPDAIFIGELRSRFAFPYDPQQAYVRGCVVTHPSPEGEYFICIKDTPFPAGLFNDSLQAGYWYMWDPSIQEASSDSLPGIIERLENTSAFIQSIIPELNVDETIQASSLSWEKVNEDIEQSCCDFAVATFDLEKGYDYLIIREYDFLGSTPCLYYQSDFESLTTDYPEIDSDWSSFHTYRIMQTYERPEYMFRYARIQNPLDNPVETVGIAIQNNERVWDEVQELYLDSFYPINDAVLDNEISNISILKIKKAGDADLSEVNKLVLQDYTEVYKSLQDDILTSESGEEVDYTDTVHIPLDEGNMALQFINMSFDPEISWDNIDVEIRLYSSRYGANESITLSNKDKHIFIVNKNMTNNGELIEWDYFKIRFRSKENGSLSYDEQEFVNSTLNLLRKPKTQSNPNPIRRNNPAAVQDFINLARSFVKAEDLYVVNQPTFLETYCYYNNQIDNFNIDAATFVNAALRGLSFDNTPYSANWTLPNYDQYTSEQPEVVT